MGIRRFEDIEAWQLARELTRKVYALTKKPAFSRDFGLRDQIRKAAGSSMHNIAEGFDAESNSEFVRFLRYAKRSCSEVQSELYVAYDEAYITAWSVSVHVRQRDADGRLLVCYWRSLFFAQRIRPKSNSLGGGGDVR